MNNIDVKQEINRRRSITARLLEALKTKGELSTRELNAFGNGCSSRLYELRKEGHKIVAIYEKPGQYRYVYGGSVDTELPEDWDEIRRQAIEGDVTRVGVVD